MLNFINKRKKEPESIVGEIGIHRTPPKEPLFSAAKYDELNDEINLLNNQLSERPSSPKISPQVTIRNNETRSLSPRRTATISSPSHQRGRIHFSDIAIPEEAPKDLICEECSDRIASLYCEECKEVFCYRCADLCHPRVSANDLKHKHEINGSIRALKPGDTSTARKDNTFYPPDQDFFFDDYEKVRDLMVPNSLSINQEINRPKIPSQGKATAKLSTTKYKVNDLVLFPDPITHKLAFGKIISEFDPVHTISAPAMLRGEGGGFQYMAQMIGLFSDKNAVKKFLAKEKHVESDEKTSNPQYERIAQAMSLQEGAELSYSKEIRMARAIDKRVQDMRNRMMLGPKHHYRATEFVKTGQSNAIRARILEYQEKHLGNTTVVLVDRRKTTATYHEHDLDALGSVDYDQIDANSYADIDDDTASVLSVHNEQRRPVPASQRTYLDYLKSLQNPMENDEFPNIVVVAERDLELMIHRIDNVEKRRLALLSSIISRRERIWLKYRVLEYFMYWKRNLKQINMVKLHILAVKIQTRARVWLCRNKLQECRDYWKHLAEAERMKVHGRFRYADENDANALTFDNRVFFSTHADVNRYAHFLALMLQRISRYLDKKRRAYLKKTLAVWKSAIYNFEEKDMQNNHIEQHLVETDALEHQQIESMDQERRNVMQEFQKLLAGAGRGEASDEAAFEIPLRHKVPHEYFRAESNTSLQGAEEEQWKDVPAYDPADDFVWPALPSFSFKPRGLRDRLYQLVQGGSSKNPYNMSVNRAASRNAEGEIVVPESDMNWVTLLQGPTHFSYWMVPSLLLVGAPPYGLAAPEHAEEELKPEKLTLVGGLGAAASLKVSASSKNVRENMGGGGDNLVALASSMKSGANAAPAQLTAIAALLMHGVDTFVSLLEEEEEARVRAAYGDASPLEEQLNKILLTAKINVNRVVCEYQEVIEKQREKLDAIPNYGRTDPRYANAQRQRSRCEARIELAQKNIKKMRDKIKDVPEQIRWRRLPVSRCAVPWTVDDVLPSLWELEKLLRSRRRCYLYSGAGLFKEGGPGSDGLSGTLAAILIGRVYQLPADEAMLRWQRAHDLMRGLYVKFTPYKLSCPPVPWQKRLIIDVLAKTQRAVQLPDIRGQLDPETFTLLRRDCFDPRHRNNIFRAGGEEEQMTYFNKKADGGGKGQVQILAARMKGITQQLLHQQRMEDDATEAERHETIRDRESAVRMKTPCA